MNITGTRILVTGAGGHLGGHIVEQLRREGVAQIIAMDRAFPTEPTLLEPLVDPRVTRAECDITKKDDVRALLEGVDGVVHSASLLSREVGTDLRNAFDVNIAGMMGLLESCVAQGVRKFVFTSSSSVYHGHPPYTGAIKETAGVNPASMYGVSKATGEMLLRVFRSVHGLDYLALRIASIYGVRQSRRSNLARVIPETFDRAEQGLRPFVHGDGTQTYDFIDVVDVARAHVLALKSDLTGKAYNVATGVPTSVTDIIRLITNVAGSSLEPEHVDREGRYNIPNECLDGEAAARELGFKAERSLRRGLETYAAWRRDLAAKGIVLDR